MLVSADCYRDDTDGNNETGKASAVFEWDEAASELVCDECEQVLLEAAGFIPLEIDEEVE